MKVLLLLISLSCALFVSTQEVRSIDGTGNNIANPTWGAANSFFLRQGGFFYSNANGEPRGGGFTTNFTLANERLIEDTIFRCVSCRDPERQVSDFAWAAGLFLALETTRTLANNSEPWNIQMPTNSSFFAERNGTLPFQRMRHTLVNGTRFTANAVSSYIDGHTIYGENNVTANMVRSFVDGLLATQQGPDGELPRFLGNRTAPPGFANLANNVANSQLFVFGDGRCNQNPMIMSMCTLWLREHNRQARALKSQGFSTNDEALFQEARRRTIALIQNFYTFEYQLMLLGVTNGNPGPYRGYDANLDATTDHFHSTVAFRYGHLFVNDETLRFSATNTPLPSVFLRDNFFDPTVVNQDGIGPILKGLNTKERNSGVISFANDLKNFMYAQRPNPRLSLGSLNMRRARDVGLPSYTQARSIYNLSVPSAFNEVTSDGIAQSQLLSLYGSPANCDPWVCGALETPLGDSELGALFTTVIKAQYDRFRHGDRFWYENGQFNQTDLATIRSTRMSDIVLRNTDLVSVSCNIFTPSAFNDTLLCSIGLPATTGVTSSTTSLLPIPTTTSGNIAIANQTKVSVGVWMAAFVMLIAKRWMF